jgi:hypothetical protein
VVLHPPRHDIELSSLSVNAIIKFITDIIDYQHRYRVPLQVPSLIRPTIVREVMAITSSCCNAIPSLLQYKLISIALLFKMMPQHGTKAELTYCWFQRIERRCSPLNLTTFRKLIWSTLRHKLCGSMLQTTVPGNFFQMQKRIDNDNADKVLELIVSSVTPYVASSFHH